MAYVKFAIAYPAHYWVVFSIFRVEQGNDSSLKKVAGKTFAVVAVGAIQPGNPRQLTWVTWSLVHGLAFLLSDRQLPLADEQDRLSLQPRAWFVVFRNQASLHYSYRVRVLGQLKAVAETLLIIDASQINPNSSLCYATLIFLPWKTIPASVCAQDF